MSVIGQAERSTQNRVIALFRDELKYDYLGDWSDRANSNIEEALLTAYLTKSGYSAAQISRALDRLRTEANKPTAACTTTTRRYTVATTPGTFASIPTWPINRQSVLNISSCMR